MPPQLEKNHVVPTAWQDEALARDGVSREVPCSALNAPGIQTAGSQAGWAQGSGLVRGPQKAGEREG